MKATLCDMRIVLSENCTAFPGIGVAVTAYGWAEGYADTEREPAVFRTVFRGQAWELIGGEVRTPYKLRRLVIEHWISDLKYSERTDPDSGDTLYEATFFADIPVPADRREPFTYDFEGAKSIPLHQLLKRSPGDRTCAAAVDAMNARLAELFALKAKDQRAELFTPRHDISDMINRAADDLYNKRRATEDAIWADMFNGGHAVIDDRTGYVHVVTDREEE